jgi:hypothetical protein
VTYPYAEKGPLDEIEWQRALHTKYGPVEIGRNHNAGVWVVRRKGLREYAPGEVEGMFADTTVAGALLAETPRRPWHYVSEKMPEPGQRVLFWVEGLPGTKAGAFEPQEPLPWAHGRGSFATGPGPLGVYAWEPEPEPPPLPEHGAAGGPVWTAAL